MIFLLLSKPDKTDTYICVSEIAAIDQIIGDKGLSSKIILKSGAEIIVADDSEKIFTAVIESDPTGETEGRGV